MLGEKSMPDGGVGQEPWQMPLALFVAGFGCTGWLLGFGLLGLLNRTAEPEARKFLVRFVGAFPIGLAAWTAYDGLLDGSEGSGAETSFC